MNAFWVQSWVEDMWRIEGWMRLYFDFWGGALEEEGMRLNSIKKDLLGGAGRSFFMGFSLFIWRGRELRREPGLRREREPGLWSAAWR